MLTSLRAPIRRMSEPGPNALLPIATPVAQSADAVRDHLEAQRHALWQRPPHAPLAGGPPMLQPNVRAASEARFIIQACQAALITSATIGVMAGAVAAIAIAAVCGAALFLVMISTDPHIQLGTLKFFSVLSQAVIVIYGQAAIVASILAYQCAREHATFRALLTDIQTSLHADADAHAYTQARQAMCVSACQHALGWGALSVVSAIMAPQPLVLVNPVFAIACLVFGVLAWASNGPPHPGRHGDAVLA